MPAETHAPCPEASAAFFSRVCFSWMSPLMAQGKRKTLVAGDLWALDEVETAGALRKALSAASAAPGDCPWLLNALGVTFCPTARRLWHVARPLIMPSAALMVVFSAMELCVPLLVGRVLHSIEHDSDAGAWWALALLLTGVVGFCANQAHLHLAWRTGQRLRAAAIGAVFRTTLELTEAERAALSSGESANLIASDSNKLSEMMRLANLLWAAPLLIAIATVFLMLLLGWSGLLGIAVLAFCVPVSKRIASNIGRYRRVHMPLVDGRLRLTGEVLAGMRVCKYFGWEPLFAARMQRQRDAEMYYVRREVAVWALSICSNIAAPVLATLVSFSAYSAAQNERVTAETAFTALLFFNGTSAAAAAAAAAPPPSPPCDSINPRTTT